MTFDASMIEESIEEKSFMEVLPSEIHRRKLSPRESQSDLASVSSDDQGRLN